MALSGGRAAALACALAAAALAAALAVVALGPAQVEPWRALGLLLAPDGSADSDLVGSVRLPRAVAGLVAGVAFGASGALLQTVVRNPLAEAGTLGVGAGAWLAVAIAGVSGVTLGGLASVPFAFAGGLLAAVLALAVAGGLRADPVRLVLAGVAIALACSAGVAALQVLFEQRTAGMFLFGAGSLEQPGWAPVRALAPAVPLLLLPALVLARDLDALDLGDDAAAGLGVRPGRVRLWAGLVAVALAAVAVSLAGPIAFVGLAAGHFARRAGLLAHRSALPVAALAGGAMLPASDAVALLLGGSTVPAGVVCTALGAPLLIAIARRAPVRAAAVAPRPRARVKPRARVNPRAGSKPRARVEPRARVNLRAGSKPRARVEPRARVNLRAGSKPRARVEPRAGAHAALDANARTGRLAAERARAIAASPAGGVAVALLAVVLALVAALGVGEVALGPGEVVRGLLGRGDSALIVQELRLPRALVAATAGAALAVCGAVLQGAARNPLAGPELLGVTGGAALSAVALLTLADPGSLALGLGAFAGALAALALVAALTPRRLEPERVALVGVAVAGAALAVVHVLLLRAGPEVTEGVVFLAGSTYAEGWSDLAALAPALAAGLVLAWLAGRRIDALGAGDELATALGVAPARTRAALLALAAALAAAAVATVGAVGFVGLMAPHAARLLVGPAHRMVVPVAALLGAALLLVADLIGRSALDASREVPSGVVTALLGAPLLLALLRRRA
jgi:ABC-type Fe3+-siderophore transport system permease subunit